MHSQDPYEILTSSALISALAIQVEESAICSVIHSDYAWLLEEPSLPHEILSYQNKPRSVISRIHDFVPDYLLDIQGGWKTWLFRNRLKVMDFTLQRKKNHIGQGDDFRKQIFKLVSLFDVEETEPVTHLFRNRYNPAWLPESFQNGYVMLFLDPTTHRITTESWIEFLGLLETPVVLFGPAESRLVADILGKQVGCTLFNACGDFTNPDYFAMVHRSTGILAGGDLWPGVGKWAGKEVLLFSDERVYNNEWIDRVKAWSAHDKQTGN